MINAVSLLALITELAKNINRKIVGKNLEQSAYDLVEENGLEENERVPAWIIDLFQSVLHKESKKKIYIDWATVDKEVDIWSFFADLENVLEGEYDNYGEGIEIAYKSIGVYILISLEGNFYKVESKMDSQCSNYALEKLLDSD